MSEPLSTIVKRTKGWSRRKQARPGEILDAALKIFAEKGFAATRMEDIAACAGVTKGTIYLYFPGKEEVFKTLVRETVGPALTGFEQNLHNFPGSARGMLATMIASIADFLQDEERAALPKIIIAESGNFPELARFWRSEVIDRGLGMLRYVLERGIKAGEFRAVPIEHTVRLCVSPIILGVIWRTTFAPLDPEPFVFKDFISTHIDILLHGLLPEGATP
jgi:AcrR family transcriptional regulator